MSHLRIRVRLTGKKHQQYIRFILVPRTTSQKGRYLTNFGYADMKPNGNTSRYVILNIYKIIKFFLFGAQPTKQALGRIYKYFVDLQNLNNFFYFNKIQLKRIVENEIKKKYL